MQAEEAAGVGAGGVVDDAEEGEDGERAPFRGGGVVLEGVLGGGHGCGGGDGLDGVVLFEATERCCKGVARWCWFCRVDGEVVGPSVFGRLALEARAREGVPRGEVAAVEVDDDEALKTIIANEAEGYDEVDLLDPQRGYVLVVAPKGTAKRHSVQLGAVVDALVETATGKDEAGVVEGLEGSRQGALQRELVGSLVKRYPCVAQVDRHADCPCLLHDREALVGPQE